MKIISLYLFVLASCLLAPVAEAYTKKPEMDQARWDMMQPYFLPANHPVKAKLDKIFNSKERVCISRETLEEAGFAMTWSEHPRRIIVGKHRDLKGYLVKFHTDDQLDVDESFEWLWRIQGANFIREAIKRHGYQHFFKVPKKWIYPLTHQPSPPAGLRRTNFILIVEDMKALGTRKNLNAWGDKKIMTPARLDAFFTILQEEGLLDSIYPDNVPFTKDGKMAFLDTQHCHKWPIRFHIVAKFLCPESEQYWNQLIQNGGPKS